MLFPIITDLSGVLAMWHGQVQHVSIQHGRLHHEMVEAPHESFHAFKVQGCPSSYPGRHFEHHRGLRLLYHNLQEPDPHHSSDEGCLRKGRSMKDIKKVEIDEGNPKQCFPLKPLKSSVFICLCVC